MKNFTPVNNIYAFLLHCITIVVMVCFPFFVTAQNNDAVEMEKKLQSLPDDTSRVNLLLKLGKYYCSVENDKALMYLQEAYTISMMLNYTEGVGKSLMWQGRVYFYKSNSSLSNKYLDKAKKPLERAGDINALSYWYLAKAFSLRTVGDYVNAIKMFSKSIELSKKTGNVTRMTICYLEIGNTLLDRDNVDKAMKYFREGLELARKSKNMIVVTNALTSVAKAYESKNIYDSSLFYSIQALEIRKELKTNRHIASSEKTVGETLIKMERYAEAEKYLKHALSMFEKMKEKTGAIITKLSLADALAKQNDPHGLALAGTTLAEAEKINNPLLLSFVYKKLSDIYASHNDYEKAYDYHKKFVVLKDSLFNSEKERMLAEVETKFQTAKKDSDIALLKEKAAFESNKNIMLIVLLIVFLLVIFLLFVMFKYKSTAFKRQQKLREQEKIIHEQENKIIEKENQLLQEQLESKNRELASKALEMIRLNETISEIIEKLEKFNNQNGENFSKVNNINKIIQDLENHTKQNIWNEFNKIFKNIHSGFYARLLDICQDLTATEIKIAALLRLNLNTKEIAAITFKSEGSIKTTRYRLRKKLGLSSDNKLVPFLMQI